jgi:hypothetical protein
VVHTTIFRLVRCASQVEIIISVCSIQRPAILTQILDFSSKVPIDLLYRYAVELKPVKPEQEIIEIVGSFPLFPEAHNPMSLVEFYVLQYQTIFIRGLLTSDATTGIKRH